MWTSRSRTAGCGCTPGWAVAPVRDEGSEPVLGVSVPVDRDTLIDRWYVHRIRLE